MRENLKKIIENAYAPYSNYRVSACVVTSDDKHFYGVNVENASYGATICAERNAINSAVSYGYKKFKALYLYTEGKRLAYPCFICRQVIAEFFGDEDTLIVMNEIDEKTYKINELLPFKFSKEDLI